MTTVLVTRPKAQAQQLLQALQQKHIDVISFPTIEISAITDTSELKNTDINQFDLAIFVSANAVNHMLPFWPNKTDIEVAAIGPATANVLTEHAIQVSYQPKEDFSTQGLLALNRLQQVNNQRIVIIAGEGGKKTLAETLQQRGAEVCKLSTYQRFCPKQDINQHIPQWQQAGINYIISTSRESLANLHQMVNPKFQAWLLATPLIVISTNMQQYAQTMGFQRIICANNATSEAIVAVIE